MSLRLYEITVTHPDSKEVLTCLGQGLSVPAALTDAGKIIIEPFRPKQDGGTPIPLHVRITLPDGRTVLRKLEAFESGRPYADSEKPVVPGSTPRP